MQLPRPDEARHLMELIARQRRARPRNTDLMRLCDALEARLKPAEVPIVESVSVEPDDAQPFDRKAYMRDYMKKRRASAGG